MKKNLFTLIVIFALPAVLFAQISPGDLTALHEQLEGMSNCTRCHTIGNALSNEKCFECHGEIQKRIAEKKGFHASYSQRQCVECHKEHHGRNFTIIRFDEKSFDHTETGFLLEGKHSPLGCRKCHTAANIKDKNVLTLSAKRKESTYLGLSPSCVSCHRDEHRGQFKRQCGECHTLQGWKPAKKFDHTSAQFQLTGVHQKADCSLCHKKTWADGQSVQFIDIPHAECNACHADAHKGKFQQACSQCHTADSWRQIKKGVFNHDATQFPLKGKHALLLCGKCHPKNPTAKNIAGETGFRITKFRRCSDCHADGHAGQFVHLPGSCDRCHDLNGFTSSHYSFSAHDSAAFPLTGAHRAVPCVKCHVHGKVKAASTKIFHWNGRITCLTCHKDIHDGQFGRGCETCHSTYSWQSLTFSHDSTRFLLLGKHSSAECKQCHLSANGAVKYSGTAAQCSACHPDTHEAQFAKNGATDCAQCHTEKSWKTVLFDHNTQSQFPLTGKHANVLCEKCHKPEIVNRKKIIIYKPLGTACIDCHPS